MVDVLLGVGQCLGLGHQVGVGEVRVQGAPARLNWRSKSRTVSRPPWASTWDVLFIRHCSIVPDTHFPIGQVGHDKAKNKFWYIEVRKNGDNHIMVNSVESLAEVN